jgi:uncharacterized membrane protein
MPGTFHLNFTDPFLIFSPFMLTVSIFCKKKKIIYNKTIKIQLSLMRLIFKKE